MLYIGPVKKSWICRSHAIYERFARNSNRIHADSKSLSYSISYDDIIMTELRQTNRNPS